MMKNKRTTVEAYLNGIAQEMELCESTNDPYPCPEANYIMEGTEGLVHKNDGVWWWKPPTDEQVEQIYRFINADKLKPYYICPECDFTSHGYIGTDGDLYCPVCDCDL